MGAVAVLAAGGSAATTRASSSHGTPSAARGSGQTAPGSGQAGSFRLALPGYRYEFPRDHFSHPDFRTEWWYYTGNLRARDGRAFGFELTFFRQSVSRPPKIRSGRISLSATPDPGDPVAESEIRPDRISNPWDVHDVYLAHFALSDLDGKRFLHDQRMNRAGPGLAGASLEARRVWNGNWHVQWEGDRQHLQAIGASFAVRLVLETAKPPVVHGIDGVSQKAAGAGRASHYVSLTRLVSSGAIEVEGHQLEVEGLAWMDHEFFTHQLSAEQSGWDWFSLQLDDGTEVMLYRLRRTDGTADPYSAGTFVDAAGRATHLAASDFRLEPRGHTWKSAATGGVYPLEWSVTIVPLALSLQVRTPLDAQEIVSRFPSVPSYWEGAIRVDGTRGGKPIAGSGYLEMTGYDRKVELR